MNYRTCIDCKKEKEETKQNFTVNNKRKDGSPCFRTRCRPCYKIHRKKYDTEKMDHIKSMMHNYYIKHREELIQKNKERYYKNKAEMEEIILKTFVEEQRKKIKNYNQ
jgi:hypothetical protein